MSLRKIGKEEFVLRVQTDLLERELQRKHAKSKQKRRQNAIYREYAKERYTRYLRELYNRHGRRATQ